MQTDSESAQAAPSIAEMENQLAVNESPGDKRGFGQGRSAGRRLRQWPTDPSLSEASAYLLFESSVHAS